MQEYASTHTHIDLFEWRKIRFADYLILGVLAILCITATALAHLKFQRIESSVFIGIVSLGLLVFSMFALWVYLHLVSSHRGKRGAVLTLICDAALSIISALVLEFCTIVGIQTDTPLVLADWSGFRLVYFTVLSFVAITCVRYLYIKSATRKTESRITASLAKAVISCVVILSSMCVMIWICAGVCGCFSWEKSSSDERFLYLGLITITAILALWLLRRYAGLNIHRVFIVIALTFGSFLAFSIPPTTGVSWDDEIHYARAAGVSYLGAGEYTTAEAEYAYRPWLTTEGYNFAKAETDVPHLNKQFDDAERTNQYVQLGLPESVGYGTNLVKITTVGAIPSAVGLWFARLVQFPLNMQILTGRWFNLLFYVATMAWAIKIIPIKKIALLGIALMPTSLFLAANYSYDPWVISVLALGVALIIRELSSPETPLTTGRITIILIILGLGICPKAIYFPIVFLLFLMPKQKFSRYMRRGSYSVWVALFIVLCAATVLLPMLMPDPGADGDVRGGSDVSSSGQINFITSNPLAFAQILGRFLLNYISPISSNDYSIYFAYLGRLTDVMPFISALPFMLLIVTFLLDRRGELAHPLSRTGRILLAIDIIGIVAMIAAALYISFTPVAYDTINGVQPRYLIPLLLPTALLFSNSRVVPSSQRPLLAVSTCGWILLNVLCALSLVVYL